MNTESFSRRQFLQCSGQALASGLLASPLLTAAPASATQAPRGETLVQQLYGSLKEDQKKLLCFGWEDPRRLKVDNNWHITPQKLRDVLSGDQQDLVRQIFDSLHSEAYKKEVWRQFDQDNKSDGGFASSSMALFGQPGSGQFEFVLTGRHCTRRCDGDSEAGTAFGGPIFYGHAANGFYEKPDHAGNAYWFQAKRANEVFQALDGKQRQMALLGEGREETGNKTVRLTGRTTGLDGIPMTELSADQQGLVRQVIGDLLAPFRPEDSQEAMKYIEAAGFDHLHMAFYKNQDVGNDGIWDVWQLEGPNMIWYFRGDPHVHCWAHIKS
ncbi:Protein of unknown function [Prosthecobacter debontii]|uniref:DUF3500 domain-containing protein n=1 Tax=Prosthecobacter debontii TaxID=48467 RepID=A0A1T4YJ39_9BACT|nr:DUF3500 domain-containing protein [Prosthecobacter debontii]SKB01285.1 Protein of unknown function [Prosthecobacter debontii]